MSASVFQRALAFTTSTTGNDAIMATAAKSLPASNGILGISAGLIARLAVWPMPSMKPSGRVLATWSMPMLPPAPGRFSTTTDHPAAPVILAAMARATESVPPPGV
ncbi:hypothetical protein D3C71_1643200 [compost metagenome]